MGERDAALEEDAAAGAEHGEVKGEERGGEMGKESVSCSSCCLDSSSMFVFVCPSFSFSSSPSISMGSLTGELGDACEGEIKEAEKQESGGEEAWEESEVEDRGREEEEEDGEEEGDEEEEEKRQG